MFIMLELVTVTTICKYNNIKGKYWWIKLRDTKVLVLNLTLYICTQEQLVNFGTVKKLQ